MFDGRLVIDRNMQTSDPNIFAAGTVTKVRVGLGCGCSFAPSWLPHGVAVLCCRWPLIRVCVSLRVVVSFGL